MPEIFNNVKKKLGCIFIENHNSELILLKRKQMIGLVAQAEQGQLLEKRKEDTQHIIGQNNVTESCIGRTSVGIVEKAGRKADSLQSIENRKFYETKGEKRQFICESFR